MRIFIAWLGCGRPGGWAGAGAKGGGAKGGGAKGEGKRSFPPRRNYCLGRYSVSITALPCKFSLYRLLFHQSIGPSGILLCCVLLGCGRTVMERPQAGGGVSRQAGARLRLWRDSEPSKREFLRPVGYNPGRISNPVRCVCLDTASPLSYGRTLPRVISLYWLLVRWSTEPMR